MTLLEALKIRTTATRLAILTRPRPIVLPKNMTAEEFKWAVEIARGK